MASKREASEDDDDENRKRARAMAPPHDAGAGAAEDPSMTGAAAATGAAGVDHHNPHSAHHPHHHHHHHHNPHHHHPQHNVHHHHHHPSAVEQQQQQQQQHHSHHEQHQQHNPEMVVEAPQHPHQAVYHHHHHAPPHHHHHHPTEGDVVLKTDESPPPDDDAPLEPAVDQQQQQQQAPQQQQQQQQPANDNADERPPSYETVRFKDPAVSEHFNDFLFALISYKAEFGTFQVDKERYGTLHSWLQNIKREYARHVHHPSTTQIMTLERRKVLESLHVPLTHRGDDHWNRFFSMLQAYKARHGHVLVPRICETPGLGDWVTDQRRQHKAWKAGKATQLTTERRTKLEELGFAWQVRNRPEWDQRYQELLDYKNKHGDCKVPQHYRENKALGKWVAKQREQYKLKQKGQHSFLTPDREEKLDRAGFLWSVRAASISAPAAAADTQMESHVELHNTDGAGPIPVPGTIKPEPMMMQMISPQGPHPGAPHPGDMTGAPHPETIKPNDGTEQPLVLQHQPPAQQHPQESYYPADGHNLTV